MRWRLFPEMTQMLVTRPEPDAASTAERLRALDLVPVLCPLMECAVLPTSLPDSAGFAALAATSANALRALEERGAIARFRDVPVYAVGERTAAEAKRLGFARVVSAGGSLGELAALLAHALLPGPVFYPVARHQSGDLGRSLAPFGVMVVAARVYEMRPRESLPEFIIEALEARTIGAALFYSRRTAEIFVALAKGRLSGNARAALGVLCLSEAVAEPLLAGRFPRAALADYPSEDAMMALVLSFARAQGTP